MKLTEQTDKYQVAFDFLRLSPREWPSKMLDFSATDQSEIALIVESIMESSALASGYLSTRVLGGSHERSVKEANRRCTAIRKVIGFTFPKSEINF
jgi:hypothetical protein